LEPKVDLMDIHRRSEEHNKGRKLNLEVVLPKPI
jgi:hypothetical protein